jgi:hypothetical protein
VYEAMVEKLRKDPLLARYVHHIDTGRYGGDNRNTEPWTALGEQRYAALLALGAAMPDSHVMLMSGRRGGGVEQQSVTRQVAVMLATRCLLAAPYLWLNEVEHLVRASPLPAHTLARNLLPHPGVFFSSESAMHINSQNPRLSNSETNWCLMFDEGALGFSVITDLSSGPTTGDVALAYSEVTYGKRFPDDLTDSLERQAIENILQRLAFIRSPYTISEATRMPRPIRRELQRTGAENADPLVYVVKLRRAVERLTVDKEAEDHDVEWRHHWWVSGHYRAQWHPSTQAHDVIWIAPYVKGPLDKPLLEKVYTVVR